MKKIFLIALLIVGFYNLAFAAFEQHQQITSTPQIGSIMIQLHRTVDPKAFKQQSVQYIVEVTDENHKTLANKSGDLIPQLTSGQITQLQAFMDAMWTKAETEILP